MMTFKKIVGILLVLSPFIFMTAFMVKQSGWKVALGIFGAVGAFFAVVKLGLILIES